MQKIQFFSKKTNKFYQLLPTKTIPTVRISGVPMHRFAKLDPLLDTKLKIKTANPKGIVLDTCAGLGYTAIFSARKKEVKKVVSFEKDEEIIKIARLSQASEELFKSKKIALKIADITKEIKKFKNNFFDTIIHDPPTFNLAPELYSKDFYKELKRTLKKRGILWHYCPNPGKLRKKEFAKKVENNIKKIGFKPFYDRFSNGFICRNL